MRQIQHPWFGRKARADPDQPQKADWFVWAEPQPDGTAAKQLGVDLGLGLAWDARREQ